MTPPNKPTAHQGVIDLTGWDFTRDGCVELSGEWQFYRQSLLLPAKVSGPHKPEHTEYFSVPGSWAEHEENLFGKVPAHGFATYRLLIKIQSVTTPLVLITYDVLSAHSLWVNGKLRREDGRASADPRAVIPGQMRAVPIYLSDTDLATNTIELVVQASTSEHWTGGVYQSFKLGSEIQATRLMEYERWFVVFFASLLFFMGCFHLVLFFSRRQDRSTLFFSLFCLTWVVAIVSGAADGWLLFFFFPDLSYYASTHFEIIPYYFAIPIALFYIQALFPEETPPLIAKVHLALAVVITPFKFASPAISSMSQTVAHIVSGFAICSFFFILIKALRHRRQSATLMAVGGIIFAICGSGDVLTQLGIVKTVYLTPFGLIVFVSCQACALALRFSQNFATTETLSLELRDKNVRLSRLDALKDEFLANTSHELRTPLSGIIGIAESMQAGAAGALPSSAMRNLDLVVASGKRLANLVNDILDFSRLKNKDISLNLKPVDLCNVVDTVCAVLHPLASGKGIAIINKLDGSLPPVWADEDRLQQIFFNLIGNGIKFTHQGSLTLTGHRVNNYLRVAIADTGIGIARDKLEDIFLSFEQVDSAETRAFGGTGLGLSITKSLVELHRGTMEVDSELGRGATFFLNLPVAKESPGELLPLADVNRFLVSPLSAPDSLESVLTEEGEPPLSGAPTVLVVDDEPVNLQVAVNQLGLEGFNVVTAASGENALLLCEDKLPDLILLDIMMPGMSGYQVCKQLRGQHSASTLPIIMVTARNRTSDLVAGFESGANDYLTKPFSSGELLVRVRSHLQLKESYQALEENSRLKRELRQRRETELELRLIQRRLAILLDTVDDALLATNESEEICFCNKAFCDQLGYDNTDLLGQPLGTLLTENDPPLLELSGDNTSGGVDGVPVSFKDIELRAQSGQIITGNVERTVLLMEDDVFQVFVFHHYAREVGDGAESNGQKEPLALINALNRNQIRLRGLEETLNDMFPVVDEKPAMILDEIKAIDTALKGISNVLQDPQTKQGRRQLAVTVVNLALEYWTEATGNSKFELARQSGLWKVYTNHDGWERTQTLDKYLDIDTFPIRPRWQLIVATCDFVLASSSSSSALRQHLEVDLARIRMF